MQFLFWKQVHFKFSSKNNEHLMQLSAFLNSCKCVKSNRDSIKFKDLIYNPETKSDNVSSKPQ